LDFVRAIFNTPVWLQAGYYLAPAAQIPAEPKRAVFPYWPCLLALAAGCCCCCWLLLLLLAAGCWLLLAAGACRCRHAPHSALPLPRATSHQRRAMGHTRCTFLDTCFIIYKWAFCFLPFGFGFG
jgi:hypothetical protein